MGEILSISEGDRTIHMHALPGKTAREWRKGRPYEYRLLRHIRSCGFQGLAIDGGGGIGNHTLWLAGICGLRVATFEPVRHEEIRQNLELNPELVESVTLFPFAIGAQEGSASHVGKGRLETGGDIEVRPIDAFHFDEVSLIKLDIEGMEADALAGSRETIARCRPVIFAEEWGAEEHRAIAKVLSPMGYSLVGAYKDTSSSSSVGRWDP